ncbi:MAG TPA: ABC transporter substrate-binding protein, partial [Myxococcaceae bacterium]|nr:ABC transporter substrate-binding protein [Myxococcaceae bacterium]
MLGWAACRPEPPRQGITVLVESPPDTLDDRLALSANGQRLAQLITPGLVTFDDQSRPVADLAESFRELDATTLEFVLRPDLTFHDGTRLTARDVQATYEALLRGKLPSPRADRLEPIDRIEALDDRFIRFHLKRPYAPILAELTIGIVPASRAREVEPQARTPIGAGPFRFLEQPDEEHLELAPFAGYYGGAPEIAAVHVRVVRDETTRVLELLKGRADLAVNAVSPAVLPLLRDNGHLRVLTRAGTGFSYLAFNLRSGPLADARVRQAICHLLDVDSIVEYRFHGLAERATGMLPANHWAYAPTAGCAHDPARAAALLDAAGFPDPEGPGGRPRLSLSYKTSTDRFRKSIALVIKEQLRQGGIEVDLRTLEFGTFFNDIRTGNFEIFTLKWASVIEPDLLRWVFGSSHIPTQQNDFGGFNRGAYTNARVDDLLQRATAAPRDVRQALYAEVLRAIDRDLPYV